jgi:hypothetical protein
MCVSIEMRYGCIDIVIFIGHIDALNRKKTVKNHERRAGLCLDARLVSDSRHAVHSGGPTRERID